MIVISDIISDVNDRTVASLPLCKEEMSNKMKIALLEVSNNVNINKCWAHLLGETSDSRTYWLNVQWSYVQIWTPGTCISVLRMAEPFNTVLEQDYVSVWPSGG